MIRLGIVGLGARSNGNRARVQDLNPEVQLVGVVDPNEPRARELRLQPHEQQQVTFYPDLNEMVRKASLDALMIGSLDHVHAPQAIEAAQYDLPLFLEKPVAVTMEQNLALERAFEHSRCQVVVGFPMRTSPVADVAHQYLREGAIGSPEHVLATDYVPYGRCYFDTPTYRDYRVTQGLFLQKATHSFDCMMYLMDSSITGVAALASWGRVFGGRRPAGLRCSQCSETRTCLESPEGRRRTGSSDELDDHPCLFSEDLGTPETGMNEDASSALLEFASGAHGVFTQVFYVRRDAGATQQVYSGYQGTLQLDWHRNEVRRVRHHEPCTDVSTLAGNSAALGAYALARNFLDVLSGSQPSRSTIWHGIQSCYACLAAKEAARTRQFVTVRQVGSSDRCARQSDAGPGP